MKIPAKYWIVFVFGTLFMIIGCSVIETPDVECPGSGEIERIILEEARLLKNTPYRSGGSDLSGMDCSAFVLRIFEKRFHIRLPRTTRKQVHTGIPVHRYELKAGDLVFFKTSWRTRHVGIYLENDRFVHMSKSQGVTVSRLNAAYWKKRYRTGRRVLFFCKNPVINLVKQL
jgi:cell wall-associated NlpC family hydrolase